MHLVDAARASEIYDAMGPGIEMSGGCAANTAAGVVSLGATAAFIGKVRDDQLGTLYRHDLAAGRRRGGRARRPGRPPRPHGQLPHRGHARRRAHHEHPPRHRRQGRRSTTSTPPSWPAHRWSTSRATCGTSSPPRTPSARRWTRWRRRRPVRLHDVRQLLRRPPPRRVPRARRASASTCSSPTRPRSPASTRSTRSTRPSSASGPAGGSRSSPAATKGSVVVEGGEVHRSRPTPSSKVVDTTGAGDLLRRRGPLRPRPWRRPRHLRPARQPRRRRDPRPPRPPPAGQPAQARRRRRPAVTRAPNTRTGGSHWSPGASCCPRLGWEPGQVTTIWAVMPGPSWIWQK